MCLTRSDQGERRVAQDAPVHNGDLDDAVRLRDVEKRGCLGRYHVSLRHLGLAIRLSTRSCDGQVGLSLRNGMLFLAIYYHKTNKRHKGRDKLEEANNLWQGCEQIHGD